jgi:hypothetical protein
MNSIHTLHIRPKGSIYVFSDPRFDLVDEPFVLAANTSIAHLALHFGLSPRHDFLMLASSQPFPSALHYSFIRKDMGGFVYLDKAHLKDGLTFWLCPALLHYFPAPPPVLYVSAVSASSSKLPALPAYPCVETLPQDPPSA